MKIARILTASGITFAQQHTDGSFTRLAGELFGALADTGETIHGKLLAPLIPRAVLCIGLNYKKHAEETNAALPQHPILFMKAPSSVQNPGDPILLPRTLRSDKVDYEAELAVVIGKAARHVSREHALDYVLGYTCANDVSARDWQKEGGGGQWCLGKSFDTFCPLGPVIVTADEIPNPGALQISTRIGDELLQDCTTADMIFDVPTVIAFLSSVFTLEPGTIILTGTPHGVGMARTPQRWLRSGEVVEVKIEHIGTLSSPVQEEAARPASVV